jgi:decaprenyl-phosphate phosphoribosyltransferase
MVGILFSILRTARPRQWLKNIALFAAIFITGHIFEKQTVIITTLGFIAFCLMSSSNYIFNDIMDVQRDRKHPFKKFRPIASGALNPLIASIVSFLFAASGLLISYYLGPAFFLLSLVFILLEYSYTLFLKHITVIDILSITAAYFLRVYAGEAATGYHISVWLAVAALSLALFLAIGKRRAELTLLQGAKGISGSDTRASLSHYSERLLDTYTAMFANSTFITYAFYTFLERPTIEGFIFRGYADYSPELPGRKWMMSTIPFVLYGIMRYMQLIYEGKGESPEQILTSDKPLLTTIILWGVVVFFVVYGIGG